MNNILSYNLSAEHKQFAKDSKELFKFVAYNKPKNIFKNGKIIIKKGIILNDNNNHNIDNDNDDNDDEQKTT